MDAFGRRNLQETYSEIAEENSALRARLATTENAQAFLKSAMEASQARVRELEGLLTEFTELRMSEAMSLGIRQDKLYPFWDKVFSALLNTKDGS